MLRWSESFFSEKKIDSPRHEAELLLSDVLGLKRFDLYLKFDQPLSKEELSKYRKYVKKRSDYYPVQYITNKAWFLDYEFFVDERVLIPRGDTEILYSRATELIDKLNVESIIDVGTGSGCLAISLKKKFPDKKVVAIDISSDAIQVAEKNAKKHNVEINFVNNDVRDVDFRLFGDKSIVVSNPPYIPSFEMDALDKEVKREPFDALDGGDNGCDYYEIILSKAKHSNLLAVVFEIGYNIEDAVVDLFKTKGLKQITRTNDYSDIVRVIDGIFV